MSDLKKFELTDETIEVDSRVLHCIKALKDFGNVKKGELGGFIEKEENLSHSDNSWIYDNARIYDNAKIYGYTQICGNAFISNDAFVCGTSKVFDNAVVFGNAFVYGNAIVSDNTILTGYAKVRSNDDYKTIKGFGTFFRCLDGLVRVNYGCFFGTIDEFKEQVNKSKNNKVTEKCLKIVDMMEHHFQKNN